jgi:hypothetical protein
MPGGGPLEMSIKQYKAWAPHFATTSRAPSTSGQARSSTYMNSIRPLWGECRCNYRGYYRGYYRVH